MDIKLRENFDEKLRLVVANLIEVLDKDIKIMLAEHSRDGLLGSGNTIKRTMDFIDSGNKALYQEVINHISTLKMQYSSILENDIQNLAIAAQESYKQEAFPKFKKSTEIARNVALYERMLPDIESTMATNLANFQSNLNSVILNLKLESNKSSLEKTLWVVEGVLLLVSVFIAGMWLKDPSGNYEPILVILACAIPLLAIFIRVNSKK